MRIDAAFPSTYSKAADLQGQQVTVTIARVVTELIGSDEHKPVVYFTGKEKGLVLNKTNANAIAQAYGYETDDWEGQKIVLFEAMVEFQGRTVAAVRVRLPPAARPAKPVQAEPIVPPVPPAPAQVNATKMSRTATVTLDDEIPF